MSPSRRRERSTERSDDDGRQQREDDDEKVVNNAYEGANIGVQGVVHGDVIYEIAGDDPPERKFEVAVNCLNGGIPRRAEELIHDVVASGYVSATARTRLAGEVAYYWMIAVLSDRPFELLEDEQFNAIRAANALAQHAPMDEWRQAHDVVHQLVTYLHQQEQTGVHDPNGLAAVFDAFNRLPGARREEVYRHLDSILNGVDEDMYEVQLIGLVREHRLANDRDRRVWKFFEPVPAKPRKLEIDDSELDVFQLTTAVCGVLVAGAGLTLAFIMTARTSVVAALVAAMLLVLAAGLVAIFGPTMLPRRYSPFPAMKPVSGWSLFNYRVSRTVDREFTKRGPGSDSDSVTDRAQWRLATRRLRTSLTNEITNLYAEPRIEPGAIDWLIAWYARQAADKWEAGKLKNPMRVLERIGFLIGAGGSAIAGLVVLTKMSEFQPQVAVVAVAWVVVGMVLFCLARADVYLVILARKSDAQATARERYFAEGRAYEERRDLLSDRPDDPQMVRWLDYDKIHLKTLAMNEYGLTGRDVLSHAFLTAAAPNARRARVRNGPPRFSAYTVHVFLLTTYGVRQVEVHLDVPTGLAKNQDRRAFRYDALASARVIEGGFRFDDGERQPLLPQPGERGRQREKKDPSSLVFYQYFRLTLTSRETVEITVENLDGWISQWLEGSQDEVPEIPVNTDLDGALRLLEAVAADGREWIAQARARQKQRLGDPSNGQGRHQGVRRTDGAPYRNAGDRGGS
ncbi:hypothetical protein [Spirillospora sp. NPDC047279]|uniref:hypothetical protein n=1 Tax=Spirillospora sp. NPDC047279 TaxID=3155478 RepID=UPI00340106C0